MLYKKPIKKIRLACVLIVISCAQCMQATTSFTDFVAKENANLSNNNSHTHNKNVKHPNNNSNVIRNVNNWALGRNKNNHKARPKSVHCSVCLQPGDNCNLLVQHCANRYVCNLCLEVLGSCPLCDKENCIKQGAQPIQIANNKKNHANYCKLSEEDERRQKQIDKDHELALKLSKQQKHHDGDLAGNKNKDKQKQIDKDHELALKLSKQQKHHDGDLAGNKKKNTEALSRLECCLKCGLGNCLSYMDKGSKVENTQCLYCHFPLSTWECCVCYEKRDKCDELFQHCTKSTAHYLCNACFKQTAKSKRCPLCNTEGSMKTQPQPIQLTKYGINPENKKSHADHWKLSKKDKIKKSKEEEQQNQQRIDEDHELAHRLANRYIAPNFNGNMNEVDFGMGIFPPNDALGGNNNNQLNPNNGAVIQGNHDINRFGRPINDDEAALAFVAALQDENPNNVNPNNNDGGALGGNNNQPNPNNRAVIQGNHDINRFGRPINDDEAALALVAAALQGGNPNNVNPNNNDDGALGGNNNNQLNPNNVNPNNENVLINNSVNNFIDKVSNMLPAYIDAQNSMALIGVLVLITFTYKLLWQGSLLLASC